SSSRARDTRAAVRTRPRSPRPRRSGGRGAGARDATTAGAAPVRAGPERSRPDAAGAAEADHLDAVGGRDEVGARARGFQPLLEHADTLLRDTQARVREPLEHPGLTHLAHLAYASSS